MENENFIPLEWHTEKRIWKNLKFWDKNPRKISERQVEVLRRNVEKYNVTRIPILDTDGTLVGGHQLTRVMSILGRENEETDVRVPNRKLTAKEFQEINVADNVTNGEFDYDILSALFDAQDLRDLGFEDKDLAIFLDEETTDFDLPDGDKGELEQITFTLSNQQAELIKEVMEKIKTRDEYKSLDKTENENSNGNALYTIAVLCRTLL